MSATVPPIPGVAMYRADPARILIVRDRARRAGRVANVSVWQPLGFPTLHVADVLHRLEHARLAAYHGWQTARSCNPQAAPDWQRRVLDVHACITEWTP